jgi:TetR/AcrR family transcriptional regulator, mexJK operon transcriptional repressor
MPRSETLDPASALMEVGIAFLEVMEAPATVATLRWVIGALGCFPRLDEEFLTQNFGHIVTKIAEYFDTREAGGDSRNQDPHSAAEQFASGVWRMRWSVYSCPGSSGARTWIAPPG